MGSSTGTCDNYLEVALMGFLGVFHHPFGRPMGRNDRDFARDAKFFANCDRALHCGQIGIAAHNNAN
jgi:hypothetical protein